MNDYEQLSPIPVEQLRSGLDQQSKLFALTPCFHPKQFQIKNIAEKTIRPQNDQAAICRYVCG